MAEFDCHSYNADVQRDTGFPSGAEELRRRLETSDAFVICSPEYNASIPGQLPSSRSHSALASTIAQVGPAIGPLCLASPSSASQLKLRPSKPG